DLHVSLQSLGHGYTFREILVSMWLSTSPGMFFSEVSTERESRYLIDVMKNRATKLCSLQIRLSLANQNLDSQSILPMMFTLSKECMQDHETTSSRDRAHDWKDRDANKKSVAE
ncbi:hypothetical protein FRX31_005007, partial [Thalictrum thalictroides]